MKKASHAHTISLGRKILFATAILMLVLGTAELSARFFWLPPKPTDRSVGTRHFMKWLSQLSLGDRTPIDLYNPSTDLLWELARDKTFTSTNFHRSENGEEQAIRISLNAEGHRDKPYSRDLSKLTVLCMGDSNFFGYPLDDADALPHRLCEKLQKSNGTKAVQVINAGVPGYTSLQGRKWYSSQFADVEYDWLLLSYINNDAWMQPHSDKHLMLESERRTTQLANLLTSKSRFLQFVANALRKRKTATTRRVSLRDYQENIRFFVDAARAKGAQLLILDYCVYPEYESYSRSLRRVSGNETHVHYIHVAEAVMEALNKNEQHDNYGQFTDRIRRRWESQYLEQNDLLWFYAEYRPEHLNELGTAWLADKIAPLLTKSRKGKDVP